MMRSALVLHLVWLMAAGCGAASQESGAAGTNVAKQAPAQASEPTLYGCWIITEINGSAPLRLDMTEATRPTLIFSPSRYSGSTGCNSFAGTGLLVGNRWFGEPPIATEQGCGPLEAQENAIIGIAAGGPAIRFQGGSEAMLTSASGSLRLRREAADDHPAVEPAPMPLAGTAWQVRMIDKRWLGGATGRELPLLTFEADRWTLAGLCAPLTGGWRQSGQVVTMDVASRQPRGCDAAEAAADEAVRTMIAATPHYVVGPNRELVMAGDGHWLTGQFDPSFGSDAKAMLRGEWRVDSVDGAVPSAAPRPPSLAFGNSSYAVWDGCNHSEGIMLTFARQLFTRGSGVSTLARCPPDPLRARIHRIVGGNPSIAKTDAGGIALVSPAGTLRLTRLSGRGFGTGDQLGLRAPATITLLAPAARLALLSPDRFAVVLDCGRIEGVWRGGQPARFSPDPIERTAPACDRSPGSDAFRLSQFFTGDVLAVTGPNRDIVLLVNEDESIAGQLAR